jgi:hypothetical protein
MTDEEAADRRAEVEELREAGYSPAEIAALLSEDKWDGFSSQGSR